MRNVAIVTGGASGLGFQISKELLARGFCVILIGRNPEKLENAKVKLLETAKGEVQWFSGDISNEAFVNSFFEYIQSNEYDVEYLFNCAGEGRFGPAEENNIEKINAAFSASLIGLILMSSRSIGIMKESGGTIVNIMSTAALKGNANESIYCAAKWGARGFTEAIKAAMKGSAVKVVSVFPGGMNTPFWSPDCGMSPNVEKFMDPAEVAATIVSSVVERRSMYVSEIIIDRK